LATPAGIEPATNSLEVVGKASSFNAIPTKLPFRGHCLIRRDFSLSE
jgi:hypothetical protein